MLFPGRLARGAQCGVRQPRCRTSRARDQAHGEVVPLIILARISGRVVYPGLAVHLTVREKWCGFEENAGTGDAHVRPKAAQQGAVSVSPCQRSVKLYRGCLKDYPAGHGGDVRACHDALSCNDFWLATAYRTLLI